MVNDPNRNIGRDEFARLVNKDEMDLGLSREKNQIGSWLGYKITTAFKSNEEKAEKLFEQVMNNKANYLRHADKEVLKHLPKIFENKKEVLKSKTVEEVRELFYEAFIASNDKDKQKEIMKSGGSILREYLKEHAEQAYNNAKETEKANGRPASLGMYKKAADMGHIEAQYKYALYSASGKNYSYLFSNNPPSDNPSEAFKYFKIAANRGHVEAQYQLAALKEDSKDAYGAISWYNAAAAQGHQGAQEKLSKSSTKFSEWVGSVNRYLNSDLKGKNKDQSDAEYYYERGALYDFVGEVDIAKEHYTNAADQGYENAQYKLGALLEESDPSTAIAWYTKAAEQGHVGAQLKLGALLEESDLSKAIEWYTAANKNGSEEAKTALKRIANQNINE